MSNNDMNGFDVLCQEFEYEKGNLLPNRKWCCKCPNCQTWINWQNKPKVMTSPLRYLCPQCSTILPDWIHIDRFKSDMG